MRQLQWSHRETVWRADRYKIELIAPRLWVLTSPRQRDTSGVPKILETSGSLSALKAKVSDLEAAKRRLRGTIFWLAMFLTSIVVMTSAYLLAWSWSPAAIIAGSALATIAALRVVDGLVSRAWESLGDTYQ